MKKVDWRAAIFPATLFLLCLVAYGPLIGLLGVYWDDWPSLWFLHAFGPDIFPTAFAIDRPAQGWLFTLTTAVFGQWMPGWHLFGILARWLCGMALAWLLKLVWPAQRAEIFWITALFVVYPGFTQQFIPITYGHQFLIYSAFLASLALMLAAIRRPERYLPLTLASLMLAIWSMFALEYFFGLELLRPVLLWLALQNHPQNSTLHQRIRIVFKHWLPYAAAAGLFLAWRISNPTPRGTIVIFERLAADPAGALMQLGVTILQDLFSVAVMAWGRTAAAFNPLPSEPHTWLAAILAALSVTAGLHWFFRTRGKFPASDEKPASQSGWSAWETQAIALGAYALLVAGWPVWVTDLRLELEFPWDRFTLPFMPGVSLVVVGLISLLPNQKTLKIFLLAALVGLSAGAQIQTAARYGSEWKSQKDFAWQLAWRAPSIQPGTLLVAPSLPFPFSTDNSLTAPVNWVYAPDLDSKQMPYLMVSLDARLDNQIQALEPGIEVVEEYRATHFEGSTSQAVVLFYDPPRCLKVIDPMLDGDIPNKPNFLAQAIPLSRPELIDATPQPGTMETMERLFGKEPPKTWCYYIQKAELSAMQEDWQSVASIADIALATRPDLGRSQAYELLRFVQGYAFSGNWEQALETSELSANLFDKMPAILCDLWFEIVKVAPVTPESTAALSQANRQFSCPAR